MWGRWACDSNLCPVDRLLLITTISEFDCQSACGRRVPRWLGADCRRLLGLPSQPRLRINRANRTSAAGMRHLAFRTASLQVLGVDYLQHLFGTSADAVV